MAAALPSVAFCDVSATSTAGRLAAPKLRMLVPSEIGSSTMAVTMNRR
jgi:hypothetical protein